MGNCYIVGRKLRGMLQIMDRVIIMSHKELSRLDVMHKLQNHSIKQLQDADILDISIRQVKKTLEGFQKL